MKKIITTITLLILTVAFNVNAGEVVCECMKVWKGGPAQFYMGSPVYGGTVVAKSMSKALEQCQGRGPAMFYNPVLKACEKM